MQSTIRDTIVMERRLRAAQEMPLGEEVKSSALEGPESRSPVEANQAGSSESTSS